MNIKYIFLLCTSLLVSLASCADEFVGANKLLSESDTLNIATYNIRLQTTADKEERSWSNRKSQVAKLIYNHRFDVFGVQEIGSLAQENDLKDMLPAYDFYSKGRDNTEGTEGERLAVFYNKTRFTLLDKGSFFLSETPNVVSKGWDAALNRICLWVKLNDTVTGKSFYFFNTHFDHLGVKARAESAKLIASKINAITTGEVVFCVGDFNASPSEIAVYNTIKAVLPDSRLISESKPVGTIGTFNGWDVQAISFAENVLIDYIFCRNVSVYSYEVLNDKFVEKTYPSDHFPVLIKCKL
jgi:endonuclease/exonuclease/phosphatase family metal-dependent hydrolase